MAEVKFMSDQENKELNEIVSKYKGRKRKMSAANFPIAHELDDCCEDKCAVNDYGQLTQWTSGDGVRFIPSGKTINDLPPGVYEIHHSTSCGVYFEKIPVRTEGLIRFPQTNSEKVVKEIENFWNRESVFKEYKLAYKRGIILWGPAGSGKSCTIQLITKDVIDRNGVVVKFGQPSLFMEGMRKLREIQSTTPVVVLMEDIDSILENYNNESEVLNILDGIDQVQKVVFLATTNYPERLGARIINRPSRFDKRFKIGHPNAESRTLYLKHLCSGKKPEEVGIDIKKWVKDTDGFSIAHLKELFVAVIILGDDYNKALETLKSMKEDISSDQDRDNFMGFGLGRKDVGEEY